jgi:hypothetical protein
MKPSRTWIIPLLSLSMGVLAQEAAEPEVPEKGPSEPEALLAKAVHHYRHAESVVLRAAVKHEPARRQAGGGGAAGRVVIQISSGGMQAPPFEGKVEAWRDRDGVTVVHSEKALPGFSLFVHPDRSIRRLTLEGQKRFSLDQLAAELVPLLDGPRLARHLDGADLRAQPDPATGDVLFSGEVSRKLVDVTRTGGLGMMTPKVLRIEVDVLVSKEGRFRRIDLKVVRNDPSAEMMRRGGIGVRIQGAGGPAQPPAKDDEHEIEGGATAYSLVFGDFRPTMRARLFKEQMEALLAEAAR